ncbi:hypothetical protein TYRP_011397 [Tyrophagus putrescentiae]|nr:hypothetical protein TYRP_011397 [Tyrophagus putrescentiae]
MPSNAEYQAPADIKSSSINNSHYNSDRFLPYNDRRFLNLRLLLLTMEMEMMMGMKMMMQ